MIVTDSPDAPVTPEPIAVKITAPAYRGVTVDTRYVPSSALLTHIEGAAWAVDYFSQKLDVDNAVAGQRVNSSGIYQQYVMIKGMELKVISPLVQTQDDENKGFTVVGTANVYPFLKPNVGDMFRANIGDGRLGIFQVTRSEMKSIYKESCFEIEYQLNDYDTKERWQDLLSKVVETVVFIGNFLQHGQNPLLHEEEYDLFAKLSERVEVITKDYFKSFFSNEFKIIMMPGQGKRIYDPFLQEMLVRSFTTWDAPELRQMRMLNVDGDDNMKCRHLFSMIFTCDYDQMPLVSDEMGLVLAKQFIRDPMLEGVYHSGVDYVVYPKNPVLTVDYELRPPTKALAPVEILSAPGRTRRLRDTIPNTNLPGLPTPITSTPLIHPVLVDSYYVFSEAFYQESEGQSQLELAVSDYLKNKPLSNRMLMEFCEAYKSWGGLELFYYVPILLLLMRANIRRI